MKRTANEVRSSGAVGLLLFLLLAGCGGDDVEPEPPPVPTTVEITPDAVELLSSGATTGLSAVVRDQNGNAMPNAAVTWAGSDPAVFTVDGNGQVATVTAVANGTGTLTATSGQASGTASVTVVQTPARLEILSGNDQEALLGTALAEPLVVRVAEQTGGVIPGVTVTFAPADEGSGSTGPSEVTTGADGTASTIWTLGEARRQRMVVAADELTTSFRAVATADPPMPDYTLVGELEPSRVDPLDTDTVEVTARITNLGDGPSTGPFAVRFTAGALELETVRVDPIEPDGMETVTITAGPFAVGSYPIRVSIDPDEEFEEWDESNNGGGALIYVVQQQVISLGDTLVLSGAANSQQLFRVEVDEQINQAFTVLLTGPNGNGDIFVDYHTRPTTPFEHRCFSFFARTAEGCELYPVRVGTYHIMVVASATFSDAVLEVMAAEPADPFDLELTLVNEGTASQNGIITRVADRYEAMIGVGAFTWPLPNTSADWCAPGMPALSNHRVDDFGLWVIIGPLDGAGNAVAMSGTCVERDANLLGWVGAPAAGAVVLDEADIGQLESDGVLEAVVTREIARALGFNRRMWDHHDFFQNPSLPDAPDADTHLNAPLVVAAFNAAGGARYAGAKAPLQNGAMLGISDAYWRAGVFGDEVMTPYITGDSQPLSRITLEALYAIRWEIDVTMADPFTLPGAGAAAMARRRGSGKYYGLDLAAYRGPAMSIEVGGGPVERK